MEGMAKCSLAPGSARSIMILLHLHFVLIEMLMRHDNYNKLDKNYIQMFLFILTVHIILCA